MYQSIYFPVDNSEHSNRAMRHALSLGEACEAQLTGCHVYAARMHDYRFKQMEFTLPEEYLEENELERQRKIHDSLITMGLELISDCYLTDMEKLCQARQLPFEKKMMDGKHSTEIIKDIAASDYDLIVLGAQGIGRTKDSQIGSVCQRVAQETDRDIWVVKHLAKKGELERDTILVGIDGSPQSFGSLMTAIDLAKRFGKKIELIGVYDPYLHYAVFKGIVEVLTEKAAKIFRFEEQNQLHEEVIDTGLAEIYQSHLNVAESITKKEGVDVTKTLLDGKCFQKVLDHARRSEPWLLVVGRTGVHSEDEDSSLGSNTSNLLRLCPCDILLTTSSTMPELDLRAEESIHWTEEAESRMARVPQQAKGIARTAILRLAVEKGHSVVTTDLVTDAMERFMPKSAAARTEKLAEALAFEKAREQEVSICKHCGVSATQSGAVKCTVCGSIDFELVTPEMVEQMAAAEGGTEEEVTYDGRRLKWTKEARYALRTLTDPYQRRRAKARIEKSARRAKLGTITVEFTQRFVEEEGGVLYAASSENTVAQQTSIEATQEGMEDVAAEDDAGLKMLGRDAANTPLLSRLDWNAPAIERILRVPSGFMRDRTQGRIEDLAAKQGRRDIDLTLVEEGIQVGISQMETILSESTGDVPEMQASAITEKNELPAELEEAAAAGGCPFAKMTSGEGASKLSPRELNLALNEAGVMAELAQRRREMDSSGEA
jgi:nucleotide-binding universal stress UspA family protein/Zn finger protein HypA/HybF involved in hydrogenase expression